MIGDNNKISITIIQILFMALFIGSIVTVIIVCCGKKAKKRSPKKGFGKKAAKRAEYDPEGGGYGDDDSEQGEPEIDPEYSDTDGYGPETFAPETTDDCDPGAFEGGKVPEQGQEMADGYEQVDGQGTSQIQKSSTSKQSITKSISPKSKTYKTAGQKELAEQEVHMKTVAAKKNVSARNYPTMDKVGREMKETIKSKNTQKVAAAKYPKMANVKQTMKETQGKKIAIPAYVEGDANVPVAKAQKKQVKSKKIGQFPQKKAKTPKSSKTIIEEHVDEDVEAEPEPDPEESDSEDESSTEKSQKTENVVEENTKKPKGKSPTPRK